MTTMKKNRLLADHLPSWSKWAEQSQQRLLLLAPSPQAPWEMKPHSCFRTSASWCLYSEEPLSQVWDWELSLTLVPAPYASNKWLPLPAGAAAGSPVCQGHSSLPHARGHSSLPCAYFASSPSAKHSTCTALSATILANSVPSRACSHRCHA